MTSATIVDKGNRYSDYYVPATTLPRRASPPNLHAEAAASSELSKSLAEDPDAAVRRLLDIAQDLCNAGSAGLSLARQDQTGDAIMRWQVVSGALSDHEATDAPRDNSPCGLCLDIGMAILISRPQRVFDRLADKLPAIAEVLTIPLYDGARKPLGTLWVAHHDGKTHFDREDVRVLEQLAAQLILALKLQERASNHVHALAALRLKDALIVEMNHRTKNTLQVASNLLSLQARASSSTRVREALLDSATRLHVLAKVHELLYENAGSTQGVLMPQLLQDLGDALRQSFGQAHPRVTLEIACDPMSLPAQDAVALALLANEAITNAYKHAFPNESVGRITVRLLRTPETLCLRIEDTGAGFAAPDGPGGMGMTLIRAFAAQLCGMLDVAGRGAGLGTSVTLTVAAPGLPS